MDPVRRCIQGRRYPRWSPHDKGSAVIVEKGRSAPAAAANEDRETGPAASQSDEQRIVCSPDVLSRVLDGEAVLLNLESGSYFGLNAVASRVWELIGEGCTTAALRSALVAEFEVSEDVAARDLAELLSSLRDRGLIRVG